MVIPRIGANATSGEGPNDDHPCHDVRLGEKLLKQTYEALRAGPGWNRTLLFITYDDTGGGGGASAPSAAGVDATAWVLGLSVVASLLTSNRFVQRRLQPARVAVQPKLTEAASV